MDFRETTVTVYGVTRTIRTDRDGVAVRTVRQMETAHTKAVRATLAELHEAGKGQAFAAAEKAATKAEKAARNHRSGPLLREAQEARKRVEGIQKRKFEAPSFPSLKARMRPEPVKFDLAPDDPMFADVHEFFDPEAEAAERSAAEQRAAEQAVEEEKAAKDAREFLDWLLSGSPTMPAHLITSPDQSAA